VWFEPVKVVEVSGVDLAVSPVHTVGHRSVKRGGLALRFPRFIRSRDDKTAQQVTTVGEIYDLYTCRLAKAVLR
jgi:DNA ligase 1